MLNAWRLDLMGLSLLPVGDLIVGPLVMGSHPLWLWLQVGKVPQAMGHWPLRRVQVPGLWLLLLQRPCQVS